VECIRWRSFKFGQTKRVNWNEILTSAAFSTILSSGIAFFVYRRQKSIDHVFDYQKHIVEKRKEAYNRAESVINEVSGFQLYAYRDKTVIVHQFIKSEIANPFREYNIRIANVISFRFWLSNRLTKKLLVLNDKLSDLSVEVEMKKLDTQAKVQLGVANFDFFNSIGEELTTLYFEDVINLSRINDFIKEKKTP
jgi:hypothetical protein